MKDGESLRVVEGGRPVGEAEQTGDTGGTSQHLEAKTPAQGGGEVRQQVGERGGSKAGGGGEKGLSMGPQLAEVLGEHGNGPCLKESEAGGQDQ